jgi:hypothetical protein
MYLSCACRRAAFFLASSLTQDFTWLTSPPAVSKHVFIACEVQNGSVLRINSVNELRCHSVSWEASCLKYSSSEFTRYIKYLRWRSYRKGKITSQNCGNQWIYCSPLRWYLSMESHGGMILTGENRKTQRETCHSATLPTTNTIWSDPGSNPDFHSDRLATNRLSYDTIAACS